MSKIDWMVCVYFYILYINNSGVFIYVHSSKELHILFVFLLIYLLNFLFIKFYTKIIL